MFLDEVALQPIAVVRGMTPPQLRTEPQQHAPDTTARHPDDRHHALDLDEPAR